MTEKIQKNVALDELQMIDNHQFQDQQEITLKDKVTETIYTLESTQEALESRVADDLKVEQIGDIHR